MPTNADLAVRIVTAFGLGFVVGFERSVRGSAAGDRTFAMVCAAAAAVTAVVARSSPQAVAGVITGVGFIGAGVVFHGEGGLITGITTAAAVFSIAGIGIVVGYGHLLGGVLATGLMLVVLELRNIPGLRRLDARRYQSRFREDASAPAELRRRRARSGPPA